jgi:hypothetical protein
MKRSQLSRVSIYFLCFSFFLMMNGFPRMMAEAKENLPIGEMVSTGEVKFEARENAWKNVETSNFPIFQKTKIKTGKGVAALTLSNDTQIDVGQKSLFSFDEDGRLVLTQGSIQFRIPPTSETSFKMGNISVVKSRSLQAAKNPVPCKNEEAVGSISIHPNGAVTVKSFQGNLSVLNQDRVVLAGLSPNNSVTLPSTTVKAGPRTMVAQTGKNEEDDRNIEVGGWFGLSTGTLALIGLGVAGTAAGIAAVTSGGGGGGIDFVPHCR